MSPVKVAVGGVVGDGLELRADGVGIGSSPQRGRGLGRFLKVYPLSVIPDHQLAVSPLQDLHP